MEFNDIRMGSTGGSARIDEFSEGVIRFAAGLMRFNEVLIGINAARMDSSGGRRGCIKV